MDEGSSWKVLSSNHLPSSRPSPAAPRVADLPLKQVRRKRLPSVAADAPNAFD
jgi:hypothetical protein